MTDPFGIAAGAVGIASVFSTCVEIFDYVNVGRRFGKDYQTRELSLTVAQLRLSRWGDGVDIYNDPRLGRPGASDKELIAAKNIMMQILVLFEDGCKANRSFQPPTTQDDPIGYVTDAMGSVAMSLNNKMKETAARRQKHTSIFKIARWSIGGRDEVDKLIADITQLLDGLEKLFPVDHAAGGRLLQQDIAAVQGKEEIGLLAKASADVDELLRQKLELKGHDYNNVDVEAQGGSVMSGNVYGAGYSGVGPSGASHAYNGVKIKAADGKVLIGDQHGGNSFF